MGKIQNSKDLAKSAARVAALAIAEAGLEAIDTESAVERAVRLSGDTLSVNDKSFTLSPDGKLIVIGVGKCALEAGKALEGILGDRLTGGIVLDLREGMLSRLTTRVGTHPYPTQANVDATKEIIQMLSGLSEKDMALFVISGGGSTLLCLPNGHTAEDEASLLRHLTRAGADIQEVNTLRKHTSRARGGFLAKYAYPAQVIALIFSDVPSGVFEFIASGPTVRDTTTVADAQRVIEKYKVTVGRVWDAALVETPKEDKYFEKVTNLLAVSNQVALSAMAAEAEKLNFTPRIMTANLRGEAREVAAAIVRDLAKEKPKTALLYGGETTVTVRAPGGKGGRNLELALAALATLPALGPADLIFTLASDGRDNTDFAGAISDIMTKEHAEKLKLDAAQFLAENNSYEFFKATGDYLLTGDTGSNVSDLIIAIKEQ